MKHKTLLLLLAMLVGSWMVARAQETRLDEGDERKLANYFLLYKAEGRHTMQQARMTGYHIDPAARIITITANNAFAAQDFTPKSVDKIYRKVRKLLPHPYAGYRLRIAVNGMTIDRLAVSENYDTEGITRIWGNIDYSGEPWVRNTSRPFVPERGLFNRHLTVYASHGKYFDHKKGSWQWQRPHLFGTTEDLFTPTIVVPFLIPMLENAGANVFTPRERDWQPHEVIVDNDAPATRKGYLEYGNGNRQWENCTAKGFGWHAGAYMDNENPFTAGTARQIKSTKSKSKISFISYTPDIPEAGRYAVYVSYQTLPKKSVRDAEYIVYHKGQETHFRVNQQMGGGTWVYLGTFDFDKGSNEFNRVMITNNTSKKGIVTADAVRFGGGMGNIQRGGMGSGLPRACEAARYAAQWAGAPYSVYSTKGGKDDYSDDINTRPLMTNWLAGGSVYAPTIEGKQVPIELSLAVHSDAGYATDGKGLVGSLSICTTQFNNGLLNAGIPRTASKIFAQNVLDEITRDLLYKYKQWNRRYLWDRNYSETRNPEIPSAIIELLSHQNFPDMVYAQDPNFKFTIARAIYKSILKFVAAQHGRPYVVQPLAPQDFRTHFTTPGQLQLDWTPQTDPREPSANPHLYIVYTATGSAGFDNGTLVKGTSYTLMLEPDVTYRFKVTAVNDGGESFPTEVLSAFHHPGAAQTVLVVNGFHRLSAPAVIDDDSRQGFDLDADMGVSYGLTAGWNGRQTHFQRSRMGIEGPGGLGYGGDELAGTLIAGNTGDYTVTHTEAIATARAYNVVSCSSKAVANGRVKLTDFSCVDLFLGLERYTPQALGVYKTFSPTLQRLISDYVLQRGALLVSGSYLGSDMQSDAERRFMANVLLATYTATDSITRSPAINGLGLTFDIHRTPNPHHYAATHPEILHPVQPAYCAMQYADGTSAAVAYRSDTRRSMVMGFPFECIASPQTRGSIMQGILNFLLR